MSFSVQGLKKQVLKNKLDDENVAYQEKTSQVELAFRLQIHLASKENQTSPILGEICATPINEQMDLHWSK
ncbi:unnamed protein product [Rhizophagus irregularis]|nr:unnamed protein product [Rhizophagus irregularis]